MRLGAPRLYQTGTPAESMIIPNAPSVGSLLLASTYQPGGASPSPVSVIVREVRRHAADPVLVGRTTTGRGDAHDDRVVGVDRHRGVDHRRADRRPTVTVVRGMPRAWTDSWLAVVLWQ